MPSSMQEGAKLMHSEILHSDDQESTFPYTYLLEWEWPEHIEFLLRRLIWSRLVELGEENDADNSCSDPSDYLAAKVCWLIAVSPQTHPAVLDVLASIDCSAYAERIAENPNADPSTLARLAGHSSPKVRSAVAENSNTPAEVIQNLARDEDADVRYALADNHGMEEAILQILCEDDNCYVAARAQRTVNRINPPKLATMPIQRTQRTSEIRKKFAQG